MWKVSVVIIVAVVVAVALLYFIIQLIKALRLRNVIDEIDEFGWWL